MRAFRVAILTFLPLLAYGQMNPQYSSYTTWTTDGTNIYQTVVVEGQTTGSCSYTYTCNCGTYGQGCQQCTGYYPGCVGATHTPKIDNFLDGNGGWSTGPSQDPFTYMSYQTTVSAPVAAGQLMPSQTEAEVICPSLGVILDVVSTSSAGQSPSCGGSSAVVTVFYPPQTAKCDASTTNTAPLVVGGSGFSYIKNVTATTSTDNVLLLDLSGNPYKNPNSLCNGSSQTCFFQDYKAAVPTQFTGKNGNIIWNVKIFCGAGVSADLNGSLPQSINCP